jgi:hypothetical protein
MFRGSLKRDINVGDVVGVPGFMSDHVGVDLSPLIQ